MDQLFEFISIVIFFLKDVNFVVWTE